MNVINKNGTQINYNIAVSLMDDEIREELHARLRSFSRLTRSHTPRNSAKSGS